MEAIEIIEQEKEKWPNTDTTKEEDLTAAVIKLLADGRLLASFVVVVRITSAAPGLVAPVVGSLQLWTVSNQLPQIGQLIVTDYWQGEVENIA